jgi:hypothetical protein
VSFTSSGAQRVPRPPTSGMGAESGMDILAFLGEDAGLYPLQYHAVRALDLPVCTRMGNCSPVHADVIVDTKI